MAINLTPDGQRRRTEVEAGIEAEVQAAESLVANTEVVRQQELEKDQLNKEYFDYFNGIISSYELERRRLDGEYILSAISETDIQQAGNLSGRLYDPAVDVFVPVRIDELDGGGLSPTPDPLNESRYEEDGDEAREYLVTGFNDGGSVGTTNSAITAASTQFTMSGSQTVPTGVRLVVVGNGGSCILVATSVNVTGIAPSQVTTVQFDFLEVSDQPFVPSGTISSGASISRNSAGFTNAERTSQSAANANRQDLLNNAIQAFINAITGHRDMILAQKAAVDGNPDEGIDPSLSPNLQSDADQFTGYLSSADVSDSGLNTIDGILSSRLSSKNTRISEIPGVLSTFYEKRYGFINLRVNKVKGSLTLYNNYGKGSDALQEQLDFANFASEAYET